MGGLPPIRFVPESGLHGDTVESDGKNRVKIQISDRVTKSFKLFVKGGPKAVIMLIRLHESIVADRKLKEVWKTANTLMTTKQAAIVALDRLNMT